MIRYSALQIFWWISYARWAGEALAISLVANFPHLKGIFHSILLVLIFCTDRIDYSLRQDGFEPNNLALDLGLMFVIGIAWRLIALFVMVGPKKIWRVVSARKPKKAAGTRNM